MYCKKTSSNGGRMTQAQSRPIALVVETDQDQRALVSVLLEETA